MKQRDSQLPKLTRNDQEVLKSIVEHAKIPDSDIAKRMGISAQAVFKIRHKLEECGIIKSYQPVLDYAKLGIEVLAMLVVKLKPQVWETSSEEQISQRVRKIPHVINAYRIVDAQASHIIMMGFRDMKQMHQHIGKLQTKFCREIELLHIYPFSAEHIITQSPVGLLYEILDKKEFPMDEFFLNK